MNEELKKEITEKEGKHKKYLFLYHLGEFLKDTFNRDKIEEQKIRRLLFFLLWIIPLYSVTQNILYTIIGFLVIGIVIIIVGKIIYKTYTTKLHNLATECKELYNEFYGEKCKEYGISCGTISFPDEIIVGNGYAKATMKKAYGEITICQLCKVDEMKAFFEYQAERGKHGTINDKIASVEFNEKFGIIPKCSELICMRYLSPTMQLGMIKAETFAKFSNVRVYEDKILLDTPYHIANPTKIDIFSKKHLKKYFKEIETYCKEMRKMADEVYADFVPLDFMRGREI